MNTYCSESSCGICRHDGSPNITRGRHEGDCSLWQVQHHNVQRVADADIVVGAATVSHKRTLSVFINVLR